MAALIRKRASTGRFFNKAFEYLGLLQNISYKKKKYENRI